MLADAGLLSNRKLLVLLEAPTLRQWQGLKMPRERLALVHQHQHISLSG